MAILPLRMVEDRQDSLDDLTTPESSEKEQRRVKWAKRKTKKKGKRRRKRWRAEMVESDAVYLEMGDASQIEWNSQWYECAVMDTK